MAESKDEREVVDINHHYMKDHKEEDFVWGFNAEKALKWAGAVTGSIIDHALHGGPEHAVDQMAIQAGMLLTDAKEGLQFPVLMMHHESEDGTSGYTPVAIMLVGDDKVFDIAHTLGSLVDDDGVHPALPSRMADAFYDPPVEEVKAQATTVMDLLAKQRIVLDDDTTNTGD